MLPNRVDKMGGSTGYLEQGIIVMNFNSIFVVVKIQFMIKSNIMCKIPLVMAVTL